MSTTRAAVTVICDSCGRFGASQDPEKADQCVECQPEKHTIPEGGLL